MCASHAVHPIEPAVRRESYFSAGCLFLLLAEVCSTGYFSTVRSVRWRSQGFALTTGYFAGRAWLIHVGDGQVVMEVAAVSTGALNRL